MSAMTIRSATLADLSAIREIYNHYVLTSTCTYQLEPETEADRLSWFQARSEKHPVIVADKDGGVVGWAALSPWKDRAGYARTVEASVYIRHDHQRQGAGRALLAELICLAKKQGHHVMIGGACTEHPSSIALQERMGFTRVGTFHATGNKFGRWLDVTYLQLLLS